MPRKASVIVLGLLASGAVTQGIVACSTDDSGQGTTLDASADHKVSVVDTGTSNSQCTGDLPVMTAFDKDAGADVPPDWSCYLSSDAGFLDLDAGDDADAAIDDASDADTSDAGDARDAAEIDTGTDAAATPDAAPDAAPDGGTSARTFHLIDFLRQTGVSGASIDFFFSRSAAGAPGFTGTTDGSGDISFMPPSNDIGVFAYRVNGQLVDASVTSLLTTIQYDNLTPRAGGTAQGQSITAGEMSSLLSGILGSQQPSPTASLVVGVAQDCQGRDLRGAVLELIDGVTNAPVTTGKAAGDTRTSYFSGGIPNAQCSFTSSDKAIWTAINAPTNSPGNTHPYSIRLTGRMHDTDVSGAIIGEQPVELWPGVSSIVRPYRLSPP